MQRRRSERLERPNAHLYETGGMRRTHLRGHVNILKRLMVQVSKRATLQGLPIRCRVSKAAYRVDPSFGLGGNDRSLLGSPLLDEAMDSLGLEGGQPLPCVVTS